MLYRMPSSKDQTFQTQKLPTSKDQTLATQKKSSFNEVTMLHQVAQQHQLDAYIEDTFGHLEETKAIDH